MAYAGSWREEVITVLSDVFTERVSNANDKLITSEVISITALSLGLIGIGSCNAELFAKLLTVFEKEEYNKKSTFNRYDYTNKLVRSPIVGLERLKCKDKRTELVSAREYEFPVSTNTIMGP